MKTPVTRTRLPLAVVAALTLPLAAHATDRFWETPTPTTASLWSDLNNWDSAPPANGDNVNFGIGIGATITSGTMAEDLNVNIANFNSANPNSFTVQVQTGDTLTLNSVTFSGASANYVTISNVGTGAVALGSNATWNIGGAGATYTGLQINAPISGAFGITKTGTRYLQLNSVANSFTGGVTNQGGSVYMVGYTGAGDTLGTGAFIFNNQSAINANLVLNGGYTATVNNAIVNNNTNTGGSAIVQVGSSAAAFTYTLSGAFSTGANFAANSVLNFVPGNGNALATSSATMILSGDFSAYTSGPTTNSINLSSGGSLVIAAQNSIAPTNYTINASNSTTEAGKLILGGAFTMCRPRAAGAAARSLRRLRK